MLYKLKKQCNHHEVDTMKLIAASAHIHCATGQKHLNIPNDADPRDHELGGVETITLTFPKFTDGRAFSQAFLLSRRLGFKGEIVATGDVLIDQLRKCSAVVLHAPYCVMTSRLMWRSVCWLRIRASCKVLIKAMLCTSARILWKQQHDHGPYTHQRRVGP